MNVYWVARALTVTLALLPVGPAAANERPTANIGTLTCVVDPATPEPFGVERKLSCTFAPIAGPKAILTGVVKRLGADVARQNKIVLAWAVLGPDMNTPARHLEGRYLGKLGAERNAAGETYGLVGGARSSIMLRPLTVDPSVGAEAALSVLELELSALRA
jgi:hypothetical protein